MDEHLIAAMEEELRVLSAKADAIRSVVALYRGAAPARAAPNAPLMQPKVERPVAPKVAAGATVLESIQEVARELVEQAGGAPVPSMVILKAVEDAGIKIEGREPRNTVSSALSRSPDFKANGRAGWTFAIGEPSQGSPNEIGEAKASPSVEGAPTPSEHDQTAIDKLFD